MGQDMMSLDEITAITDPVQRAQAAEAQRLRAAEHQEALALIRAQAAAELRSAGHSYGEIGRMLGGMTRERARQLVYRGRGPKEHDDERVRLPRL